MEGKSQNIGKKKPRKMFIERFKTEVKESSSHSNSHHKQRLYSSISPKHNQHSLQRKTPLRPCTNTTNSTAQYSSYRPAKQKIKLVPSSLYQPTPRKDNNTVKNSESDPFNAILMNIFQGIQFKKGRFRQESSNNLENVKEGVILAGILFENVRKLSLLHQFQTQAKTIENMVKKVILKLQKKYQQQLDQINNFKDLETNKENSTEMLKIKLFDNEGSEANNSLKFEIQSGRNAMDIQSSINQERLESLFKKKNGHSSCRALSNLPQKQDKYKTQQIKIQQLYSKESQRSPQSCQHPESISSGKDQNKIINIYHDLWQEEHPYSQVSDSESKHSFLNQIITAVNSKFKKKAK